MTVADDDVNLGHLGLALVSYCKIAALYVKHLDEELNDSGLSVCLDTTPMGAANEIFLGEFKSIRCRFSFFVGVERECGLWVDIYHVMHTPI